MFKSAVIKLTLWYVVLALSLSLSFSGILFYFAHNEIKEGLDRQYNELTINEKDTVRSPRIISANLKESTQHLTADFMLLNVVVVIGASFFGYILAKRTLKPIEEAHDALNRFSMEASHELKTPLTSIRAATETVLITNDTVNYQKTLQDNLEDINKLDRLTSYLLQVAQNGYDVPHSLNESMNIKTLIMESIKSHQTLIKKHNLKIIKDLQPLQIEANYFSLNQLVNIILDNAIKYNQKNGTIIIATKTEKAKLLIRIEDSGIGINKSDLKNIYNLFYRSKHSSQLNGFGVGLYLAHQIVARHKGKIDIKSKVNKGTVVQVWLPLKPKR